MKVSYPITCPSCGCRFEAVGFAKGDFPPATCPQCADQVHFLDRLSISIVSDRLLQRSRNEMDAGDYTLSIICGAMAVECALTQVFFKWKRIQPRKLAVESPVDQEMQAWEKEYRKGTSSGGFEKSADFVSDFLCGKKFDGFTTDFYANNRAASLIAGGLPSSKSQAEGLYIHCELFHRRNKIMHWGKVDYRGNALLASNSAYTAVNILKLMDKERSEAIGVQRDARSRGVRS